jgi:YHS domain-containing protein
LDGEIYYFCSEGCKEAFERNPKKYLFPEDVDVDRNT